MENRTKSTKMKFLRFLPKATAVVFQNHPFSPTKAPGKTLPCLIIPKEARLSPDKSLVNEPTSPKISCMGQIKHKKKNVAKQEKVRREKRASLPKDFKFKKEEPIRTCHVAGRMSDVGISEKAPSLSQMKRFASGRDSMASFDWMAQISSAGGDEEEVIIPFSAPMALNREGLEPKKEINLWKRRTMAQPRPLRI